MESVQHIKQRFGVIGNDEGLNRALEKALRVSGTEISVLVTGESGVGKENIPKIIHQFSPIHLQLTHVSTIRFSIITGRLILMVIQ